MKLPAIIASLILRPSHHGERDNQCCNPEGANVTRCHCQSSPAIHEEDVYATPLLAVPYDCRGKWRAKAIGFVNQRCWATQRLSMYWHRSSFRPSVLFAAESPHGYSLPHGPFPQGSPLNSGSTNAIY